jgi:hypothetical protein
MLVNFRMEGTRRSCILEEWRSHAFHHLCGEPYTPHGAARKAFQELFEAQPRLRVGDSIGVLAFLPPALPPVKS